MAEYTLRHSSVTMCIVFLAFVCTTYFHCFRNLLAKQSVCLASFYFISSVLYRVVWVIDRWAFPSWKVCTFVWTAFYHCACVKRRRQMNNSILAQTANRCFVDNQRLDLWEKQQKYISNHWLSFYLSFSECLSVCLSVCVCRFSLLSLTHSVYLFCKY